MSSKKQPQENILSSKVKQSAKSLKSTPSPSSKPLKNQVITRSKLPDLSPVNVIEQISQMLRKEVRSLESKKAIGE
ncbi:MAG: hypothetical protein K2Y01_06675 [Rhabdochlamydiaceae bacterium]|nr:hypothetical protein [Rhabdochlamydiaceae bacterium]